MGLGIDKGLLMGFLPENCCFQPIIQIQSNPNLDLILSPIPLFFSLPPPSKDSTNLVDEGPELDEAPTGTVTN